MSISCLATTGIIRVTRGRLTLSPSTRFLERPRSASGHWARLAFSAPSRRSPRDHRSMQRTLVLVKPDGVQRGLVGAIVARLERRGLKLIGLKMMRISKEVAARHYAEHQGKPFFDGLIAFITSGPVVAMIWEGREAVTVVRSLMGATDPLKAGPGTIRGDLALDLGMNLIRGSDSPGRSETEIALFFDRGELYAYDRTADRWIRE